MPDNPLDPNWYVQPGNPLGERQDTPLSLTDQMNRLALGWIYAGRDASETATNEWFKGVEPSLLKIGAVTLAPSTEAGKSSGLTFHYPPYAVGPYAEGEYVAFVPWETLKPYLTPEAAHIFGGTRPKADEDDGQ